MIGPSGAGKTTLLRLVAGLLRPSRGSVECDGVRWFGDGVDVPAERRRVGFVFQDYALFPHLSVHANVAFEARRDPDALLAQLGIDHLRGARPRALSGGERQRGRAGPRARHRAGAAAAGRAAVRARPGHARQRRRGSWRS